MASTIDSHSLSIHVTMEPANKKVHHYEMSLCSLEAVAEIVELRGTLQDRDAALEVCQEEVAQLRAEVTQLRAEAIECNDKMVAPTLPHEIWAYILEFSWYSDVARLARVSRSFLHEVTPQLRTLYVDDEEALTPQQAPRFRTDNVIEVVMDCIFTFQDPVFGQKRGRFRVLPYFETCVGAKNMRHFLACFSNLRHVFIGRGDRETKENILRRLCLEGNAMTGYDFQSISTHIPNAINYAIPSSEDDECRLRTMILNDAFQCCRDDGLLVYIHGLPKAHQNIRRCRGPRGHCASCRALNALPQFESRVYPGLFLP
jgi:hypothetical protein